MSTIYDKARAREYVRRAVADSLARGATRQDVAEVLADARSSMLAEIRAEARKCAFGKCRRRLLDGQEVVLVHPGELGSTGQGSAGMWGAIHAEHVSEQNMELARTRDRVRTWPDEHVPPAPNRLPPPRG